MTPFQFIYQKLELISEKFPHIGIRYEFNTLIKTHIIEFSPECEFENNDSLAELWVPFSMEFKEVFPNDDIAFVPPSSSLAIKFPECEFLPMVSEVGELDFFGELSIMKLKYSFVQRFKSGTATEIMPFMMEDEKKLDPNTNDASDFYNLAA